MTTEPTPLELGRVGAWFNPVYSDDQRTAFVAETEAIGFPTAWLGLGQASVGNLALMERVLEATSTIVVATAIVNMWPNDPIEIARSYHRLTAKHGDRFLLGVGIGHPEVVDKYRRPYATMVDYLDQLDRHGVPVNRRILAALGPKALRLASRNALGTHPYLVVPDHTRDARQQLGPDAVLAPEHAVVLDDHPEVARRVARAFLAPYLRLSNYMGNPAQYGFSNDDFADGGSDRLVDALVLHGDIDTVANGLHAHHHAGADHVAVQILTEHNRTLMPEYRKLATALL